MPLLLATLPYGAAVVTYWLTARDLFATTRNEPPSNWAWRLVAPVAVGGLTPLGLASKTGLDPSDRDLLVSAVAAALVFVILSLSLLRHARNYRWLERPVSGGPRSARSLARHHLVVAVGSLILIYGAAVNIAASAGP